jgi:hypothetical protein
VFGADLAKVPQRRVLPRSVARRELSKLADVRQQIERAFADVPYPGDDRFTVKTQGWLYPELIADFKSKHWRDVPTTTVRAHFDDLALFSEAGTQFYLPAYLLGALIDGEIQYFLLAELTIHTPEEDKEGFRDLFLRKFSKLTQPQKDAVRAFLEYLRDESPDWLARTRATKALERYWAA